MALSRTSQIVAGSLALCGLGYLVYATAANDDVGVLEYMFVEQAVQTPSKFSGRTIKVHGVVVAGSVQQKRGTTGDYRFVVEHGGKKLPVHFTNIPPDTFQEGGEVILTGTLSPDGTLFTSDDMSAKCPSKYEEQVVDPGVVPGRKPTSMNTPTP